MKINRAELSSMVLIALKKAGISEPQRDMVAEMISDSSDTDNEVDVDELRNNLLDMARVMKATASVLTIAKVQFAQV